MENELKKYKVMAWLSKSIQHYYFTSLDAAEAFATGIQSLGFKAIVEEV